MPYKLQKLNPYVVLLLLLLVAYLPLSSFYFGMKNDAFSVNFPNKFFLTTSIRNGHLPLWNPYIDFGFPVYADMGFAYYNPITWFFAAVTGYNAYTLTLEVLVYIYIGGVCMYQLGRFLKFENRISLVIACMYMCSGFYAGCLQYINFLTAAAFLPLVVHKLLQLFANPNFKSSFLFAIACYFVFVSGHPAMPILLLYFIAILIALLFLYYIDYRNNIKKITAYIGCSILIFSLLFLPAIYSYFTILPYYARSLPAQQSSYADAGFTLSSYISFVFPFSTAVNIGPFGTVVTMRSGFFSITGVLCVICSIKTLEKLVKVLLIAAGCMLILSFGGGIKSFLYSHLPLLGYIRYNGEFRIYAILCFCIIAGFGLQQLNTNAIAFKKYFITSLKILTVAGIAVFAALMVLQFTSLTRAVGAVVNRTSLAEKIKQLLQGPFNVFLLASSIITVAICLLSLAAIRKNRFNTLLVITVIDLAINTILYLPVTGVGQTKLKDIQAIYNHSPQGFPIPALTPVNKIDTFDARITGLVGDATYYNKQIGTARITGYPSYFKSVDSLFSDSALLQQVTENAYLFIKRGDSILGSSLIHIQKFSPQRIELTAKAENGDTLVFLQNNYKFWNGVINVQKVPICTAYGTFISIALVKGENDILFYYQDKWLYTCLVISLLIFLTGITIIIKMQSQR